MKKNKIRWRTIRRGSVLYRQCDCGHGWHTTSKTSSPIWFDPNMKQNYIRDELGRRVWLKYEELDNEN